MPTPTVHLRCNACGWHGNRRKLDAACPMCDSPLERPVMNSCAICGAPTKGVVCEQHRGYRDRVPIELLCRSAESGDRERAAHRLAAWTNQARRIWREMGVSA